MLITLSSTAAGLLFVKLLTMTSASPLDSRVVSGFSPLSTAAPPFDSITHPYPPVYNSKSVSQVVPTNSWYSNLFWSSTNGLAPTFSEPYILRVFDIGYGGNPGLSIRQPWAKTIGAYGATNNIPADDAGYYINSLNVDLRATASEWGSVTPTQNVTAWDQFSATLKLSGGAGSITFPIVRGMAYVTAQYVCLTPQFFSQNAIIAINGVAVSGSVTANKFKLTFNDNPTSNYIIYVLGGSSLTLTLSGTTLTASAPFTGTLRIAKLPSAGDAEFILDDRKAVYPTGGVLSAAISGTTGCYQFQWTLSCDDGKGALIYALPHHLDSFDNSSVTVTDLTLGSGTHGPMKAVISSTWNLTESPLSTISWLPKNPVPQSSNTNTILAALQVDIASNYTSQTFLGDNYFSGKGLQKLAFLALILNRAETKLSNPTLAATALSKIKAAFLPFLNNAQPDPFRYDTLYKGTVARSGLPTSLGGTGDVNAAFAAIIKYLDPTWNTAQLEAWTEALIRDVNNPSDSDTYFPIYRNWDWFAGHSWAGGIKINGALDGKDQESISEAINFYWGAKLYALAKGNSDYANLVSLQLSIFQRAIYKYFWMLDNNAVQPTAYIKNKVVGIFFENKCDYTTYFGRYIEYIHGIQQLPMTPILGEETRTSTFVQQEWDQKLAGIIFSVTSGWQGVLYSNYAIINPAQAYYALQTAPLDDGLTRSWALYFASTRPNYNSSSANDL
ncbi:endo-1,3(4)-beta-glucanase [Jimgerdemannia flammicorona]|uniref:glucan endo-1,3-beta-D-glucosidase n=1 Tax=Jimgerdemannia flammicorona TaxID=994334 RepID=A0A433D4A2_9FUNG|nr:endo-1,3(4)-beta-glucanase [Jimgerdemannia flammicorona]